MHDDNKPLKKQQNKIISNNRFYKQESYNAVMLIKDLKKELQFITKTNICDRSISKILGQIERHIEYIKKNYKRNIQFQISLEKLSKYKSNLKQNFEENSKNLIKFIEKYERLNDLRKGNERIFNFHPNFNLNYFKYIDCKEKAYWLGLLYADGGISFKRGGRAYKSKNLRIRFGLKATDKSSVDVVNRFAKTLGIENKYVYVRSNGLYGFEITNDIMAKHLIKHGLIIGKDKTYHIKLPKLRRHELYLAFLLGYYDGDGKKGTTRITSASYSFIKQIKEKFNLRYKIYNEPRKEAWSLHLGAELFNEMMKNFQKSMLSKRRKYITKKKLADMNTKLKITKKLLHELQILVLIIPLVDLSNYYGISPMRLGGICKVRNIKLPPRGYWFRKQPIGISPITWELIKNAD